MTKPHSETRTRNSSRKKVPDSARKEAPSVFRMISSADPGAGGGTQKADRKANRPATSPRAPAASREVAGARISRRAADRLRTGHIWVYASDIESLATGRPEDNPPALLPVADNRGLLLGTALYSPTSQIALRMISPEAIGEAEWLELLSARLRRAVERRKPMLDAETDACRLCFSEADEIPGLVADLYGNLIILQLLTRGLDSSAVRRVCVDSLRQTLTPDSILERPDPRMRELEGLSAPGMAPLWAANPNAPATSTVFRLNGLDFLYDANAGQKTGAFLDQRLNYVAAADWAKRLDAAGRALDVCTYQGGFALHLARACRQVTGIDASRAS